MNVSDEIDLRIKKGERLLRRLCDAFDGANCTNEMIDAEERLEDDALTWDDVNHALISQHLSAAQLNDYAEVGPFSNGNGGADDRERIRQAIRGRLRVLRSFKEQLRYALQPLHPRQPQIVGGLRVFIGHGRDSTWREVRDFVEQRLKLDAEEFNRAPIAGVTTTERLEQMLGACSFALLVLTAEDEHADGSSHPRSNVIHEAGLCQGRYGFRRAIILMEEGCSEFSNIHGLGQIRFRKGNVAATFEAIRGTLEREGLIATAHA